MKMQRFCAAAAALAMAAGCAVIGAGAETVSQDGIKVTLTAEGVEATLSVKNENSADITGASAEIQAPEGWEFEGEHSLPAGSLAAGESVELKAKLVKSPTAAPEDSSESQADDDSSEKPAPGDESITSQKAEDSSSKAVPAEDSSSSRTGADAESSKPEESSSSTSGAESTSKADSSSSKADSSSKSAAAAAANSNPNTGAHTTAYLLAAAALAGMVLSVRKGKGRQLLSVAVCGTMCIGLLGDGHFIVSHAQQNEQGSITVTCGIETDEGELEITAVVNYDIPAAEAPAEDEQPTDEETTADEETTSENETTAPETSEYPADDTPVIELIKSSDSLYVKQVEGLDEDFFMGADISSILALEKSGVKFYDYDGSERDIFEVLAESGVNCIRVRIWVDPYDAEGNSYGGGACDIDTAVEIAKRCKRCGLGMLADFHYSDFWCDPGKQKAPKAWADMDIDTKAEALHEFTAESLEKLKATGVALEMVQVGNETNGAMCGEKTWENIARLMNAGSSAVREISPETLVAVHFTNPEKSDNILWYASQLDTLEVDYDVFGTSYYPFWHGTTENLTYVLSTVKERYGKEVMVAETSYAYTLEDGDGHENSVRAGSAGDKPYPYTVQGQSRELADVIDAVAAAEGIGVFYWEPAWLPVAGESFEERSALWEKNGAGWASSYSSEYDPDDAGKYFGGSSWDNQAMFDFGGRPLESLKTFALVRTGNELEPKADAVEDFEVTVLTGESPELSETVEAVFTDGSVQNVAVTWNELDLAAIDTSAPAVYLVGGKAEGFDVVCTLRVKSANYVPDGSFESGSLDGWDIDNVDNATSQIDCQWSTSDSHSGNYALHFWGENGTKFTASRSLTGLAAGSYSMSAFAQGGWDENQNVYIFCKVNGEEYTASVTLNGWCEWDESVIDNIEIPENAEVVIGVYVEAGAGSWGTVDDFTFSAK
ncbi:glycosyl hydrolase 53 family protein [Ruminococcus sp.]|uniref:glycosyl hydrolase 53 family protein n=1 Tax=Ruminococcus sp. TaxID=41978 RepID=UPI0025D88D2E|nr:glycosyl hydrolase 53 family protein [Ruminococcus sp.]MBQ8966699.1 glycosyl hydrolase 53 family protein [Ruminococcus sp.]